MDTNLKEIIIAYFNGGNATSSSVAKPTAAVKADLEAIRDFYKESQEK